MDVQDIRNLQEAYMEVVENQQLNELTPATPENVQRVVNRRLRQDRRNIHDGRGSSSPFWQRRVRADDAAKKYNERHGTNVKTSIGEQYDLYDIVMDYLLDEGYAETPEAAEAIMVNMSEEWRDGILQQLDELSDWTVRAARNKLKRNTQRASGPGRQEHANREFQFNKKINARNQRTGSNVSPTDVEFRNR
jgi:hypothetical protein